MSKTYGNFTDFVDFSRSSSATYLGSDGLIKTAANNIPRVEYDANGVVKGLLIEEARTNLLVQSGEFNNADWNKTRSSVTDGTDAGPDGNLSISTVTATSSDANGFNINDVVTISSGATTTFSAYIKKGSEDFALITLWDTTASGARHWFDLSTGQLGSTNTFGTGWAKAGATIENVGNDIYRISFSVNTTGTTFSATIYPSVLADLDYDCTLNDVGYIGLTQLEQGSFPTSYIPTTGATATRSADIASIATANFGYNKAAGTLVVKFLGRDVINPYLMRIASLNNGYTSNRIDLLGLPSEQVQIYVVSDGSNVVSINTSSAMSAGQFSSASVAYSLDDYALVMDGNAANTDTSASVPIVDALTIGTSPTNTYANGHIRSIKYIPRRITDTQLQEQTA